MDFIIKYYNTINNKNKTNNIVWIFFFFFYLGFLSRTFMNHRTAGEGGGHFFNSSLPAIMAKVMTKATTIISKWARKTFALAIEMTIILTAILVANPARNQTLIHLNMKKFTNDATQVNTTSLSQQSIRKPVNINAKVTFNVNSTNLVSLLASCWKITKTCLTKLTNGLLGLWKYET